MTRRETVVTLAAVASVVAICVLLAVNAPAWLVVPFNGAYLLLLLLLAVRNRFLP